MTKQTYLLSSLLIASVLLGVLSQLFKQYDTEEAWQSPRDRTIKENKVPDKVTKVLLEESLLRNIWGIKNLDLITNQFASEEPAEEEQQQDFPTNIMLIAIIEENQQKTAILSDGNAETIKLEAGGVLGDWELTIIESVGVTFTRLDDIQQLELFKNNEN